MSKDSLNKIFLVVKHDYNARFRLVPKGIMEMKGENLLPSLLGYSKMKAYSFPYAL